MQAVVLAAGEETRLRPLTEDKPKALVEVAGRPILSHCFNDLIELGTDELLVVVGYKKEKIIDFYGDEYEGVPITYTLPARTKRTGPRPPHRRGAGRQRFHADAWRQCLRDELRDVINRHWEDRADAAFLVEEVPYKEASRYGVCDTNGYGETVEVVEKPDDPPTNLVMTGFYTYNPTIFHACRLTQPSDRSEYELLDPVDLLIKSGRTIDAIRMDG